MLAIHYTKTAEKIATEICNNLSSAGKDTDFSYQYDPNPQYYELASYSLISPTLEACHNHLYNAKCHLEKTKARDELHALLLALQPNGHKTTKLPSDIIRLKLVKKALIKEISSTVTVNEIAEQLIISEEFQASDNKLDFMCSNFTALQPWYYEQALVAELLDSNNEINEKQLAELVKKKPFIVAGVQSYIKHHQPNELIAVHKALNDANSNLFKILNKNTKRIKRSKTTSYKNTLRLAHEKMMVPAKKQGSFKLSLFQQKINESNTNFKDKAPDQNNFYNNDL